MKKTITINLNGIVFNIEEDAYEKLNKYFDSIKAHFAGYDDGQEILNDIEARAAEKFSARINAANQVITLRDAEKFIKTMGTVEAITDGQPGEKQHKEQNAKKLFRDANNAYIFGVASGLAAYFGVKPIIFRLAFFISLFFGGAGIIIYIILSLVVPEAKTTADKIEMRGDTVTLSAIKETAREKIETAKKNLKSIGPVRRISMATGKALGKGIKIFAIVILAIIGISIIISAVAGIIGIIFGFGTIMFSADSPYLDFPVREILPNASFYIAWTALALVAIIPMIFLLILGTSIVRRKSSINLISGLSLLMVWVISLTAVGIFAIKAAPQFEEKIRVMETAEKTTKTYDLKDFGKIDSNGQYNIVIAKGEDFKIEAAGQANDIERLELSVDNGMLKIKNGENWHICFFCLIRRNPLSINIIMPSLESFKSRGVFKADVNGFNQEEIKLDLGGVGETSLNIFTQKLFLAADGVTKTILTGSSALMQAEMNGISSIDGLEFPIKEIMISTSGASKAKIWAVEKLNAEANDASRIYYKGEPKITEKIRNAGKLEPIQLP